MPDGTERQSDVDVLDDEEFEDIEHELWSSTREMAAGFGPCSDLETFRAAIKSSHYRVDHRRLW